jgi:AraC-like DNA-binding protein
LKEISTKLAFRDQESFSRFFKKLEGKTPKAYRNHFAALELTH